MCLSLETLMYIIRTGLTVQVKLTDLVNWRRSQMTLIRWLTFLLGFQTEILSPACWDLFIFSDTNICATMAFLPLVNSDIIVSVSIDLSIILITTGCLVSLHCLWLFLCWLRCSMKDIFKLGSFTAASDFCEWIQLATDVCISHGKYQVKPHTSPWFSATCLCCCHSS